MMHDAANGMREATLALARTSSRGALSIRLPGPKAANRLGIALLLAGPALLPNGLGDMARGLLADAYLQVSVFVAATLLAFYGAEKIFKFDIRVWMRTSRHQVPISALLGTLPGCGGAVVVVAAHTSGNVSFGSVVAALTATMGDAAFLLIATRPDAAAVALPVALAVGVVSGLLVDKFSGFGREAPSGEAPELAPEAGPTRARDLACLLVAIPGLAIGILLLFQVDLERALGQAPLWIGVFGAALGLLVWVFSPVTAMTNPKDSALTRMAEETSFISVWVIAAFLAYEYLAVYAGMDLGALFSAAAPLLPLAAIIVGFIPGCGPQVLVTTLYINGVIPFAALLGNAISNDGDALFPAIAISPRVALAATLYSAVPATVVAYGFYFFLPGFLS